MVSSNKLTTVSVVILSSIIVFVTFTCLVMFHGSPGYMSLLAMLFALSLIKAVVSISVVNQKEKLSDIVINRLFGNSEQTGHSSVGRTTKKRARSASGPVVDFRDEELPAGISSPSSETPPEEDIAVGISSPLVETPPEEEIPVGISSPLAETPPEEEISVGISSPLVETPPEEDISVGISSPLVETPPEEEISAGISSPLVETPPEEDISAGISSPSSETPPEEDISVGISSPLVETPPEEDISAGISSSLAENPPQEELPAGFSTPSADGYLDEDISVGLSELTLDRYLELSNFVLSDEIMSAIEWKRFELLCHLVFRASGFNSRLTGDGADEGVDIRIYDKENSTEVLYLVQCKKWNKKSKIDRPLIQQLRGQMAAENVEKGGYCVTSSFTTPAVEFAAASNIELFDQQKIIESFNKFDTTVRAKILKQLLEGDYWTPSCATCGRKFSVRTTRSGKRVWACVGPNGHGWNSISYYEAAPITQEGLYSA